MLAGALLVALAACAPEGRPIVAEVFYDATGDDTGLEFVELYNPAVTPASLAGARLEAGDGAGPGRWTLRWTGGAADSIPARGRFVVGGARVVPAPQAVVELGLQNGPDAIRLVWPDGDAEVLGYGALDPPEYFCGAPAADAASGLSLARVPDAANLGSNALDFRPAPPSPGAANQPERDLALVRGSLALAPEQPAAGAAAMLAGVVIDRGGGMVSPGEAAIVARGPEGVLATTPLVRTLAPGDTASFHLALPGLPAGKAWLVARVALPGDEAPGNDADSVLARIGPGPLVVTEIQFHPAAGEGEWVEVRANVAADPAAFTLSDRGATRGVPAAGEGSLAPDSLAILAQDRAAFLVHHPGLDGRRVWQVSPWAALNNSDDSTGIADAVVLRERDGTRSDRVDYAAAGVPPGVPIELAPWGGWEAGPDPAGTPLAPPRPVPVLRARFELAPRRIAAGAALDLAWSLPWPVGRVA
ncbi:MAG TPA: hypothetical protein VI792_00640, partial [Candidatus Eisenbacteria bacterium]